jgi:hypothetical protein
MDQAKREELFELYSELHLTCGRAATALRLAGKPHAPQDELLARFHEEQGRAAELWSRIKAISDA